MDQAIKTAEEKVKRILSNEEQMRCYEAIEDARRNMVSSMRYNWEKGKEEGIEQGKTVGEKRLASLMKLLLEEKRMEELEQVVNDNVFREKLYKEYSL